MDDELPGRQLLPGEEVLHGKQTRLHILAEEKAPLRLDLDLPGHDLGAVGAPDDLAHAVALQSGIQKLQAELVELQVLQLFADQVGYLFVGSAVRGRDHLPLPGDHGKLAFLQHRESMAVSFDIVIDLQAPAAAPGGQGVVMVQERPAVGRLDPILLDGGYLLPYIF